MYSIYSDGVCIYNDVNTAPEIKMIDPTLTLSDNTAGTLKFKLPQSNVGYDSVNRVSSIIKVYKEGKEIWEGRAISEGIDFWNNRSITCEGELGYLNDTIQFPPEADPEDPFIDDYGGCYYNPTPYAFLEHVLANHNANVEDSKKFYLGNVTVTEKMVNETGDEDDEDGDVYVYTDYISTLETIKTKLVDPLNGHLVVRKEDGKRYLDYLADYYDEGPQTIEFRKNLLDFTRNFDESEFATVIIPLGKQFDITANEGGTEYLEISDVNDGIRYLKNDEAVSAYGWIEKIVNFDDVEEEDELLEKGQEYLTDLQFANLTLKLNAYDLHYLDNTIEDIKLLHQVRVISRPHGLDRVFPITELTLNMTDLSGCTFTLGEEKTNSSLSSYTNRVAGEVSKEFSDNWDTQRKSSSSVLGTAKKTARSLINNATRGYITISRDVEGTDAFYIANNRDYRIADKVWKWGMGGLAYFPEGLDGDVNVAITGEDGCIVANAVTTGTMLADRVRAGVLQSENSNVVWNLSTGDFKMNQGSINIGNKFIVDNAGNLQATSATVTGAITATTLTATSSGKIGPLTINNNTLSYGSTFSIDGTGHLTARSAYFEGDVYCTSIHADFSTEASGVIDGKYVELTNLNADNITAGTINADYIDVEGVSAGDIESVDITSCNIYGGYIEGAHIVSNQSYYNTTFEFYQGDLSVYSGSTEVGSISPYTEISNFGTEDLGLLIKGGATLYLENRAFGGSGDTIAGGGIFSRTIQFTTQTNGNPVYIGGAGKLINHTSSTRKIKHDILPLKNEELDPHKLYDLPIVQFKYNDDYLSSDDQRAGIDIPGLIAEEVYDIYPIAAQLDEVTKEPMNWDVRYLFPSALYLIQEQHKDIENLKKEIERIKNG